jgi:hypothetical protein
MTEVKQCRARSVVGWVTAVKSRFNLPFTKTSRVVYSRGGIDAWTIYFYIRNISKLHSILNFIAEWKDTIKDKIIAQIINIIK